MYSFNGKSENDHHIAEEVERPQYQSAACDSGNGLGLSSVTFTTSIAVSDSANSQSATPQVTKAEGSCSQPLPLTLGEGELTKTTLESEALDEEGLLDDLAIGVAAFV